MGLFGIKGLASIAVVVLLISGCSVTDNSNESKPEYDQLEVILWEACIYDYLEEVKRYWNKDYAPQAIDAEEFCKKLKPVKE
ncbi:MAG: hypothetical protein ACKOCG_01500, partial [Candidatus Nanopelagicus sp.]